MKDLAEIYQSLLDGHTLVSKFGDMVRLHDGCQQYWDEGKWEDNCTNWQFDTPKSWEIYKEPQWYDNIPEGGSLCRVRDDISRRWYTDIIIRYTHNTGFPFESNNGDAFRYAEPLDLTKPLAPQLEIP